MGRDSKHPCARAVGLLAAVLWLGVPTASEAAGPWRGQVVDAETGQPLADVAVIGVWHRRVTGHPALFLGRTGLVGAAETTTDATGRFTLPTRFFVKSLGIGVGTEIREPELGLFRAGYGGWRFREPAAWVTRRDGVIEMRPLSTPDERRKYLDGTVDARGAALGFALAGGTPRRRRTGSISRTGRRGGSRPRSIGSGTPSASAPIGIGYPHLGTKYLQPAPPAEGPEAAWLRGASAVAIDAAGLRYVADTEHHRIVVFDPTGAMVQDLGPVRARARRVPVPARPRAGPGGDALRGRLGESPDPAVHPGRPAPRPVRGPAVRGLRRAVHPVGVAAPDTGEIVVYADGIYTFTPDGRRLDTRRRIPFRTETRCGIAVDAAGYLYVVDAPDHRVHKLDREGRVLASFGRGYGEGAGQLFDPIGLTVDAAGRVWVADWFRGAGRVHGFAPDGRLLGTWSVGDDGQRLRLPQGVAVDAQGRVHVADRDLPALVTITPRLTE